MHDYYAMVIDVSDQLNNEGLHLALVVVSGICSIVVAVIGWLLRRDIKRSDEEQKAMAAEIVRVDGKVDANDRRHGYEIADTRIAVAPLFTKAGLDQPNYTSR